MKVYDASSQSMEALKEAFVQKDYIKIGNILYEPEYFPLKKSGFLDACQFCRFYRVKSLCKSHIADKVCTACTNADLEVNYNADRWELPNKENTVTKLHYLQRPT